jgi:hypothetical protein
MAESKVFREDTSLIRKTRQNYSKKGKDLHDLKRKQSIEITILRWQRGSSSGAPAYQVKSPEFKLHYHYQQNKNIS